MRLIDWKNKNNLTYKQIAEMLSVTQAHVTMIANGKRSPSIELLQRIVKVTNNEVGDEFTSPTKNNEDKSYYLLNLTESQTPDPSEVSRVSVDLPTKDVEEAKNIVWWLGGDVTLTSFLREALRSYIKVHSAPKIILCHPHNRLQIEKPAGQPFPPREGAMRRGRPLQ